MKRDFLKIFSIIIIIISVTGIIISGFIWNSRFNITSDTEEMKEYLDAYSNIFSDDFKIELLSSEEGGEFALEQYSLIYTKETGELIVSVNNMSYSAVIEDEKLKSVNILGLELEAISETVDITNLTSTSRKYFVETTTEYIDKLHSKAEYKKTKKGYMIYVENYRIEFKTENGLKYITLFDLSRDNVVEIEMGGVTNEE